MVAVGGVDFFVLGFVGGIHVPVKAVFQARGIVFIFYPFELLRAPAQRMARLDKMGFGLGDEPVGQYSGDLL